MVCSGPGTSRAEASRGRRALTAGSGSNPSPLPGMAPAGELERLTGDRHLLHVHGLSAASGSTATSTPSSMATTASRLRLL